MPKALDDRPIFVLGRQHSGNTMLAVALGLHHEIHASIGESLLLEHTTSLARLAPPARAKEIARHLQDSAQPPLSSEVTTNVEEVLAAALARTPTLGIGDLMSLGMQHLAAAVGKTRWAQKATSYIFYVDTILELFPKAQLIYLSRNPFDIGASLKRRGDGGDMIRAVIAWNKGVKLAFAHADAEPARFRLVHYERLVTVGEVLLREVMDFLGHSFEPGQLDIPHVNRSEQKYTLDSNERGFNDSRIYYFKSVLTADEIKLIHHYVEKNLLNRAYPDLARELQDVGRPSLLARARSLAAGGLGFAGRTALVLSKDPRTAYDRIVKRLGS